jgi:hypothetical protein
MQKDLFKLCREYWRPKMGICAALRGIVRDIEPRGWRLFSGTAPPSRVPSFSYDGLANFGANPYRPAPEPKGPLSMNNKDVSRLSC